MTAFQGKKSGYATLSDVPAKYGRACVIFEARGEAGNGAKHPGDAGVVCLKVFKEAPQAVGGGKVSSETLDELTAQKDLDHPYILPVLDYGLAEGSPFIVYPWCRGGNLRDRMEGRTFLPLGETVGFLRKIAEAVDHAHNKGYIHGDIKPENILFLDKSYDKPYLSDFGMSKYYLAPAPTTKQRSTAVMVSEFSGTGTFDYLSPEQLQHGTQSVKSDLYALAVVAFELLTGAAPFSSKTTVFQQMTAKIFGDIDVPKALPADFGAATLNALKYGLSKNDFERPGSAMEFCKMLTGEIVRPAFKAAEKGSAPAASDSAASDAAGASGTRRGGKRAKGKSWFSELDIAGRVAIITGLIAAVGGIVTALIETVLKK
jgi:serine/threonine protein kinase